MVPFQEFFRNVMSCNGMSCNVMSCNIMYFNVNPVIVDKKYSKITTFENILFSILS